MKASMLTAIANIDDPKDPKSKHILRRVFDAAKLTADIDVYNGANHGGEH